jgi:iron(III) transport system substrate-binding protein
MYGGLSTWKAALLFCAAMAVLTGGCSDKEGPPEKTVVVYTALDRVYSEPILEAFEQKTGIRVSAVYDTEAAKTTGLINRLIARRDDPDCDVLWNNEIVQTERLAQMGLLAPYVSPQAERFAAQFRDEQGFWTGFAARMRVIIYNTKLIPPEQVPTSLSDLTDPKWRGRGAIARPLFGTTLTHMAVLYQRWGPDRLRRYLEDLRRNDVAVCLGNATVRDMVAAGERAFGLTDTDDAHGAMIDGKPVNVVIPDATEGAVLIPNTVALIANSPHPETGRKLIDYLLSEEVERRLASARSAQIPLAKDLTDVKTPWDSLAGRGNAMAVDVHETAAGIPRVVELLKDARMDQ